MGLTFGSFRSSGSRNGIVAFSLLCEAKELAAPTLGRLIGLGRTTAVRTWERAWDRGIADDGFVRGSLRIISK